MKLQTKVHTIFMLIGSTECGKTTFAQEVLIPALQFQDQSKQVKANVQYLSSDRIRQEILGYEYDKYDQVMLESSDQAFHLLFEKLRMVTSFPIHAEFIVLDTTGLSEDFRAKVREIAHENNYNLEVILFDYRKREDYYASDRSKKLITNHINRLKKEVLRSLSKEGYSFIHRVRHKDFYSPSDKKANPDYQVVIENLDEYLSTILPQDHKYVIVGDIHECLPELKGLLQSYGFTINENKLVASEKVRNIKVLLAGDWIDKGKATKETIEFLYENQDFFLFVMGNHENFVYKYLHGLIKGIDRDLLDSYFDSIHVLKNDEVLLEKFNRLFSLAKPFYKFNGITGPSFYVTHAPCKNKYIGKLDAQSVRRQRSFRVDRSSCIQEQLQFLSHEAVKNHPYHIFGHIAATQPFRIKNKLHIDTGCVHGHSLTSVMITHRPFFKTHQSKHALLPEELPTLFQEEKTVSIEDLDAQEVRRLNYSIRNKINFITGTMCPADKDEVSNELESLKSGLSYFADREVHQVVLQPKYMGSRCTIYLHRNLSDSFAVSRNGYKINQIDLTEVYQKLLNKFHEYMEANQISILILDGELLPWRAIGEGLIEKQFKTIEKALEVELTFLENNGFEQAVNKLVADYKASGYEQDQFHCSKGDLIEKYGSSLYQNYKHVHEVKESFVSLEEHVNAYQIYKKQLDLYAEEGQIEYKPFSLLKVVFEDGKESIPQWTTSKMYRFLSEDDFLLLDLTKPDWYERANRFFTKITREKQMEGIVIKPEIMDSQVVPYLKVRNPDYLSIIYGYDYRFPYQYKKLMKQKNINQKLRTSQKENRLGNKMLLTKYNEIAPDNDHYKKLVANMLFEVSKEKEIDPRL